ncbi:YdcF family protein [Patescibacteria group bacterium]
MYTDEQLRQITEYIFLPPDPKPCDIGFVFGTRLAGPVDRAYEAFALGLVPRLLLSGGANRHTGVVEADWMAAELEVLGVPPDRLLLENRSTNSLENVMFSRDLVAERLAPDAVRSILVIAKHFHVRRAMMTLKRHFPAGTALRAFPYEVLGFTRDNWHESEVGREKVLAEWKKIPKYFAKGDIEEL